MLLMKPNSGLSNRHNRNGVSVPNQPSRVLRDNNVASFVMCIVNEALDASASLTDLQYGYVVTSILLFSFACHDHICQATVLMGNRNGRLFEDILGVLALMALTDEGTSADRGAGEEESVSSRE